MTYKELPKYCLKHMCKAFVEDSKGRECEYQALCTRFYKKYNLTPEAYLKNGGVNTYGN